MDDFNDFSDADYMMLYKAVENAIMCDPEPDHSLYLLERALTLERPGVIQEYNNRQRRKGRLYKRIKFLQEHYSPLCFVTLTFTDKILARTSFATRRRYVYKYLHSQSDLFVVNLDYGELNGREHYHALLYPRNGSGIELHRYNLGAINARFVSSNPDWIPSYLFKLTNHALKVKQRLYYSRDLSRLSDQWWRAKNLSSLVRRS